MADDDDLTGGVDVDTGDLDLEALLKEIEGDDPVLDDEPEVPEVPAQHEPAATPDPESGGNVVVLVHDKMRKRRITVRREEGQRRLKRIAWALAGLCVVVDGAALAHTPFFAVHDIQVVGARHTAAASVRWASGIHEGDTLLTIDTKAAARHIEELPWVAGVQVERHWPDTVRLAVTERTPAAVVQTSGGSVVATVDAGGRVLQINGAVPPGLVTVTDVPLPLAEGRRVPATVRGALRLAIAASKRIPGALVSVSTQLEATLGAGGRVRFGSLDDLDEKLLSVATVLARVDLTGLDVLDVEVPGSPTVSRGRG